MLCYDSRGPCTYIIIILYYTQTIEMKRGLSAQWRHDWMLLGHLSSCVPLLLRHRKRYHLVTIPLFSYLQSRAVWVHHNCDCYEIVLKYNIILLRTIPTCSEYLTIHIKINSSSKYLLRGKQTNFFFQYLGTYLQYKNELSFHLPIYYEVYVLWTVKSNLTLPNYIYLPNIYHFHLY